MAVLNEHTLEIYVDGSSLSKPRRGGVGIRYVWIDPHGHAAHSDLPRSYSYDGARIGQMELRACIEAIKELISRHPPVHPSDFRKVVIHTDSRYVADNYPNVKGDTGARTVGRLRKRPRSITSQSGRNCFGSTSD